MPDSGPPAHWRAARAWQTPQVQEWIARDQQRQEEERRRLLYVGLTRAESWLIVAAAGETGTGCESWHAMVADGFDRAALHGLAETRLDDGRGSETRRLSFADWPAAAPQPDRTDSDAPALPAWLTSPAPPLPRPARPVAATACWVCP